MSNPTERTVHVQITIDGSVYSAIAVGDTDDALFAHNVGRGISVAMLEHSKTAHVCENCPTCGVHGDMHLKCCGCYDGVCCQKEDKAWP